MSENYEPDYDIMDEFFGEDPDAGPEDKGGYSTYHNVECVHETAKAIICLVDGNRRVIPKSQLGRASEVNEKGDKGDLQVKSWFANKMEHEDPQEDKGPVTVPGCVVLRQARSNKAIEVKLPDGREIWIPVTQILEESECRFDGDSGKLVITSWIAGEKGIKDG